MLFQVSLDELQNFASRFWSSVGDARVFLLHGEMGAGKTTLVAALCRSLGVREATGSPTFSIINQYAYQKNGREEVVYHLDLYRLNSPAEAVDAGVEDCLYSGALCLVEWPEKAPGLFDDSAVHVYLEPVAAETRKIEVVLPPSSGAESNNNRNL
jgi:tRNA threonylcarbamoyladenosine biosynthesis protein TsaE